ncbi:hypothetical protein P12x_000727 [Tundrisphaera lichenicola]|uniref:hypothetical protein n=1 Tax=Tundrisphaera lichenicola TaxID=2029860 RepID=UPI003EBD142E
MDHTLMLEPPSSIADDPPIEARPARRGRLRRGFAAIVSGWEWLLGAASLLFGLSILAAFPIAQFLSLGYLLEASGRVARSGRLRDGWIGVRRAGRVGGIVAGAWLCVLPARFVASMASSAELIDPGGPIARQWWAGLMVLTFLTAVHVAAGCARGGRLRHFVWPPGTMLWLVRRLRKGGMYVESRDATWEFVRGFRLPYYLRLGALGFAGAMSWLVVPVVLLASGQRFPLLGILGALGLGFVVPSLSFLQARYAMEGRFAAMFEVRAVRERFRRAPWAFALAFFLTVAAAIPLYLLKIEIVPKEATWLPGLLFVGFLFPARLACGWAYARGDRRETPRHWAFRGIGRLGMLPVLAAYVLIVFLAQYTSWGGLWSLYEQHAFLLPVPFLGY